MLSDPKKLRTRDGFGYLVSWRDCWRGLDEAQALSLAQRLLAEPGNVDEKLTTALLDRLGHHAHILTTKGTSYRTRKRRKTSDTSTTTPRVGQFYRVGWIKKSGVAYSRRPNT